MRKGTLATGLLFIDQSVPEMHELNDTTDTPLTQVPFEKLCPGSAILDKIQEAFR